MRTLIKAWFVAPSVSVPAVTTSIDVPASRHVFSAVVADLLERTGRRQRYLQLLNRVWLAFGMVALLAIPVYPLWQISLVIAIGTSLTFVIVQTWLYHQHIRAACYTFCVAVDLVFLAIFATVITVLGPVEAFRTEVSVLMLMGITTTFAAALIAPRAGFVVAAINTVVIIGLRQVFAPEVEPRPSVVVFGWLLASVAFLYERSLREVFSQLRSIRMQLETTVQERTRELTTSVASLEALAEQLKSANSDLELFSASVAHDLRAPLRVIEGYSRLLQDDFNGRNPDAEHAVQKMLLVERRMTRLIEGLLTFARLGHHAAQTESVDMRTLAQRVVAELSEVESSRNLKIIVGNLPPCIADPVLIEQVVVNLLSNAIKFTRTRTEAHIEISGENSELEVIYSIRDNGVGFAMEQGSRLFNTLQRLHSQDEFEGSGIGLAMVKRIVQRHGGRVWAKSQLDSGAEFSFSIPRNISSAIS